SAARKIDSVDWDKECEDYLRYKGDPWGRASAERDESFGRLGQLLKDHGVNNFYELIEKEKREGLNIYDPWRKSRQKSKPSREQFERWWAIVTDPIHVQSEISKMPKAREGSKRFLFGQKE
ncbi:MAG: hypothetical protein ACREX3_23050, partial [Gammaproteobacteria bacterium]